VESFATILLLVLAVALLRNMAAGTWREWLRAKFIGS
jgi:hypothetical protein